MSSPPQTLRLHLFGFPIAHSAAPAFHNECFKHLGLPHRFALWSTSTINQEMLDEMRSDGFGGAAITMPLKTDILQHLDELTPAATVTKACNTIIKVKEHDGSYKLVGTNTDVLGVRNSLLRTLRVQHPERSLSIVQKFRRDAGSALVIGGGATTRSAVYALMTLGLSPIFLINRDEKEVRLVIESFKFMGTEEPELIHLRSLEDIDRYLGNGSTKGEKPELAIVVGAIPAIAPVTYAERLVYTMVVHILSIPRLASMAEQDSNENLPLPTRRIFLDMAYKPRLTPMRRIASALGWEDVGGVQAMIEQGLAQQRMWKECVYTDKVASGDSLSEYVEQMARRLVEEMDDVNPVGAEVDRSCLELS
ncbi:hypothetical protein D9619_012213 [Psilocybe cf. subviscida]|uniref:Shikimate dehydrogenase substrate binding N-terminal domain-containing protein n=1 Tax=Psilocybe cf. subviscida TaxID=2480587 RepID=A0A8H5B7F7_9AGAR|nr:hypothetical protein D9619_012213 [Psilocybe cf. subviscida]